MNVQPLVSIIMPAFNCENYIEQAIESIKEQTYTNWELIIIEDCSTDTTWEKIKTISHKQIHIYRNPMNCGVAQTRNRGVELAAGDWIAFLDSDDLWVQEKLEKQIALLNREKEAPLVFTGSGFISETNIKMSYVLHVPEKIARKRLLKQNLISCSSVLVKKDLLKKYPMPTVKMIHEDFAVWLQILSQIPHAYGIDEPLLIYRISSSSKSGNKIKAARMNWNTYRYIQMNIFQSLYYMAFYMINGYKKYSQIGLKEYVDL